MIKTVIAPVIALAGLATAQTAQAQQQACVGPADITDAVLYAMPIAFDAARTACTNRLARSGFMATKGNAFIAPFRTGQDKAWSGACGCSRSWLHRGPIERTRAPPISKR